MAVRHRTALPSLTIFLAHPFMPRPLCYSMISKTVRFFTFDETALRMVLMA
jgi:hypothetical protein